MQGVSDIVLAFLGLAVSSIAPLTALAMGWSKARLEEKAQAHTLAMARVEQDHTISNAYLDRTLNQDLPLAIRQQLLRFLSTSGSGDAKLQGWAAAELKRVDAVVEGLDLAIGEAERQMNAAKDPRQLAAAERELRLAVGRKQSAVEPKRRPPPTPAALKAGMYSSDKESLIGINLESTDLQGANVLYCNMVGANMRNANAVGASFQGCDLRGANLDGAVMAECILYDTDLRGASLLGTDLRKTNLKQARLEGANLTNAMISDKNLGAVYDANTIWPDGFNAEQHGCMLVDADPSPVADSAAKSTAQ